MTPRERVIRTLTQKSVDRPPYDLWTLPGVAMFQKDDLDAFTRDYPADMVSTPTGYKPAKREKGTPSVVGSSTDAWGCVFEVKEDGVVGEVKHPLFADEYEGLDRYEAPWEVLEGIDRAQIALECAQTDHFVLANTHTRPFERMQFLRGTEDLFCDLALDDPRTYELRDKLHEFYKAEMRFWASTPVDGVSFMDDWGTQRSLLIRPEKWRQFFKPLYRDYCDILHAAGKFAFFHSDGFIEDIYPDLIDVGIDAVNSQLFCMDIEKLGREYAGKIAFRGEIDRQFILPFGTPEDARNAVRRVYKALCPKGDLTGVFCQCEWGVRNPPENIRAVFDEWTKIGREQGT